MIAKYLLKFGIAGLAAFLVSAHAAPPLGYPDRPIRMIIPNPPGGGTDIYARMIAPRMAEALGKPVVIDNRGGAAGTIAAVAAAKTLPADGYTVLLGDRGMYAVNPSMFESLPYDPQKDLAPVTLIARMDFLLMVNPQVLPVSNVAELIAAARKMPTGLNYASPGFQSTHHMAMQLFARDAGITVVPVTYKGAAPALTDLLGGQIGVMFLDRAGATPSLKSGQLRAIATAGTSRLLAYPDIPTVAESGLKDFSADAWLGFTMRRGTPDGVIEAVREAFIKSISDPDLRQKALDRGINPISSTPEEFGRYIEAETVKWRKVVRERGIKAE